MKCLSIAMQNLIIVEKMDFLRDMVELCLEEDNIEVIGLKDASDFEYLIKDVKPQIFMVDVNSIGDNQKDILKSFHRYHPPKGDTLFVFTGVKDEVEFLQNNSIEAPFMVKPISPNGLKDRLESLLGKVEKQ